MKQYLIRLACTFIVIFNICTINPMTAQYVRTQLYNYPVTISPILTDSNYTIRPQWLNLQYWGNNPMMQQPIDMYRAPWVSAPYPEQLKARFKPYPRAYNELMLSEEYSKRATRWMQVGYVASMANNSVGFSNGEQFGFRTNNTNLSWLTLGALIPGMIYGTKSNKHREKAVKYLNLGE